MSRISSALGLLALASVIAGCGTSTATAPTASTSPATSSAAASASTAATPGATATGSSTAVAATGPWANPLPGMPVGTPGHVYAADAPGNVAASVASDPQLLYVPDSAPEGPGVTWVIDQHTHKIIRTLPSGMLSQHVTPSYDLRHLYVEASEANRLAVIDPATGKMRKTIPVERPYNLYFTPDGKNAIVMDEQHQGIVWSNPRTFARRDVLTDPSCSGPNHADFSANGRYFVVSCEFSGSLLKVSTLTHRVLGRIALPSGAKPQDVRLAPDGRGFYVADMGRDRLLWIPWNHFAVRRSWKTLMMPHGIYPSRDEKYLYVSMRMSGAVQVFDLATHRFTRTWKIPGGGSPDMGGLSADGSTLWLSGRYDGRVYGWNTTTGKLIANIKVPGSSPHGLLVWPQPGTYSLGHTGNMR
ncbi:beta-propeller fold lactonase family protein [Nocardioides sp.]|uniref:YVTN family beta-propeller repeat protein n=1 Tax=Nocardioides sp. TaxID=35761 RepID=UPI0026081423|nr:beta-propeller fold lactonase family protein [Nocardioides sp.]